MGAQYLFLLQGDHPEIAKAEIKTLIGKCQTCLDNQLIATKVDNTSWFGRLAYTKSVFKLLFKCSAAKLWSLVKKTKWALVYDENFCVRKIMLTNAKKSKALNISEKEYASPIWHSLEKNGVMPHVKLEGAKTQIYFIFFGKEVACGLKVWENNEDFEARRPHLRPGFSPVSLHPKFARAMVNLTGVPVAQTSSDVIYDPFCGTGGIIIEAGLMGIISLGSDNSNVMRWKCHKNIKQFNLTTKTFFGLRDARDINQKMRYLATDLPYGRSSTPRCPKTLINTYLGFAKVLDNCLLPGGRAVVCFSNHLDFMSLMKKANKKKESIKIKKVYEFKIRIHKTLNRRLVVLERKPL